MQRSILVPISILTLASIAGCTPWQPEGAVTQRNNEHALQTALESEDLGIICEDRPVVGSRITREVCTTAEQRAENHVAGRHFVEDIQNRALAGPLR